MDKFAKRLLKREEAICDWLKKKSLDSLLIKADQILNSLPREEIKEEYQNSIKKALEHCVENDEIKALDFQWYYGGHEVGGALAYGLDSCVCNGRLSKTDLGPDELPGIELELEHGDLIDEDFSEIPVYHAINTLVTEMNPIIEQSEKELGNLLGDTEQLITEYFQIWNYKVAHEACEQLKESDVVEKLSSRAPFWVTMTRHERWSVAIMLIN